MEPGAEKLEVGRDTGAALAVSTHGGSSTPSTVSKSGPRSLVRPRTGLPSPPPPSSSPRGWRAAVQCGELQPGPSTGAAQPGAGSQGHGGPG